MATELPHNKFKLKSELAEQQQIRDSLKNDIDLVETWQKDNVKPQWVSFQAKAASATEIFDDVDCSDVHQLAEGFTVVITAGFDFELYHHVISNDEFYRPYTFSECISIEEELRHLIKVHKKTGDRKLAYRINEIQQILKAKFLKSNKRILSIKKALCNVATTNRRNNHRKIIRFRFKNLDDYHKHHRIVNGDDTIPTLLFNNLILWSYDTKTTQKRIN